MMTFEVSHNLREKVTFLFNIELSSGTSGKESAWNTGDTRDLGSIPGSGRSSGADYGNPLQYFCLENPMDRGTSQAIVHGVDKSRTQLK